MSVELFEDLIRNAFFQVKYYFDVISQLKQALDSCKVQVISKSDQIINVNHLFTKKMLEFNHEFSKLQSECLGEIRTNMKLLVAENEVSEDVLNTERFDMEIKQMLSLDFSTKNPIMSARLREKIQQFNQIVDISGTFRAGGMMIRHVFGKF